MTEDIKLGVDFVNREQLSFAKWVVGLSIAIISFTFAFLLKYFPALEYKWIFILSLILFALSIIGGVRYVWIFLAGLGYSLIYKSYNVENEKSVKQKEEYKKLKDKYGSIASRFYYEFLQITFLLGLICLSMFTIANFLIQK